MPSPAAILTSLASIANEWRLLAFFWHLVLAISIALVVAGWRPSPRTVGTMLVTPIASVSVMAWWAGNPFNAATFALLAMALSTVAWRLSGATMPPPSISALVIGGIFVVFGWFYPHFLHDASLAKYSYEAPLGLIPCPTLAVVAGVSIVARGLGSRRWSVLVSFAALFYGLIGVVMLDVAMDAFLIAAAVTLAIRQGFAGEHSGAAWRFSQRQAGTR